MDGIVIKVYIFLCFSTLCNSLHLQTEATKTTNFLQRVVEELVKASQEVAFTACLTRADHLGDHQTVEYNHVISNIGGGYDTRHSHFTAPVSGLFQFSATVMSHSTSDVHLHIVKNGLELIRIYSAAADYETGTNEVNVHLNKGDMVWVQNMDRDPDALLDAGNWNCFSGILIQADV